MELKFPFGLFRSALRKFSRGERGLWFFVNANKPTSQLNSSMDFARIKTVRGLRILCWSVQSHAHRYSKSRRALAQMQLVELSSVELDEILNRSGEERAISKGFYAIRESNAELRST